MQINIKINTNTIHIPISIPISILIHLHIYTYIYIYIHIYTYIYIYQYLYIYQYQYQYIYQYQYHNLKTSYPNHITFPHNTRTLIILPTHHLHLSLIIQTTKTNALTKATKQTGLRSKLAAFLSKTLISVFNTCCHSVQTLSDFNVRVDCGEFALQIIKSLFPSNPANKQKPSSFREFSNTELGKLYIARLWELIQHNIKEQDCFVNGNEFSDIANLKIVFNVIEIQKNIDVHLVENFLKESADKVITVLTYCEIDRLSFFDTVAKRFKSGQVLILKLTYYWRDQIIYLYIFYIVIKLYYTR